MPPPAGGHQNNVRAAEAQCRVDSTTRDGHLLTGQGADDLPEF